MKKYILSTFVCIILIFASCNIASIQKMDKQQQDETRTSSANSIDIFYKIEERNIILTAFVSWQGIEEADLIYSWQTSDEFLNGKNATISIPEEATFTIITLYVFHGEQKEENLLGTVRKTISLTETSPSATATSGIHKLFLFADDDAHPDNNPSYMYFALQIEGTSSHGTFRTEATKNEQAITAYPRSVQYEHKSSTEDRYTSLYAQATPNLASLSVGYTDETGFSNETGTSFSMPFYFGDNKCRVKIKGSDTLLYTFANFVLWDTTVDTFFGGYPVFIRFNSSNPLKIIIPMNGYNPAIHKNVSLLTLTFNDDAKASDFKYSIRFDGFEPK